MKENITTESYSLKVLTEKYGQWKPNKKGGKVFTIKRDKKIMDEILYADLSIQFRKRGKFKKIIFSATDFISKFDNMIRWFEDMSEVQEKKESVVIHDLSDRGSLVDKMFAPPEPEPSTIEVPITKDGWEEFAQTTERSFEDYPYQDKLIIGVEMDNHTERKIPRKSWWRKVVDYLRN